MKSISVFGRPTISHKVSLFRQTTPATSSLQSSEKDLKLSNVIVSSLNTIDENYVSKLANKDYQSIPQDFENYINLYDIINKVKINIKNKNIQTFLNITMGSLKGAVEAYSLYSQNKNLTLNNNILNEKLNQISTGENLTISSSAATGTLAMEKVFNLTPLFSYYINTYGLPEYGKGFDPERLSNILNILNENGIDPYK